MMKHPVPEAALSAHIAIVGKTGSGKTYSAKGIVEDLLRAKKRVCIIDPTGAWYGLRSSADGKHAGFPVAVFGGEGYDPQGLAGHKDASTTAVYLDDRGAEWVDVRSA